VSQLKPALRALELYCQETPPPIPAGDSFEWFDLGLEMLNRAGGLLEGFYQAAELRQGRQQQLAELRSRTRQLVAMLETNGPPNRGIGGCAPFNDAADDGCLTLRRFKWADGGLWFEHPEEALRMHRQLMLPGWHPPHLPLVIGWSWADRQRVPGLLKEFVQEVSAATNAEVRLEGLYLALLRAPFDATGNLQRIENELLRTMWERRQELFSGPAGPSILTRTECALRKKYGINVSRYSKEPFASFQQRLRKDYLMNARAFYLATFTLLFEVGAEQTKIDFDELEARELLPLFVAFEQRVKIQPAYASSLAEVRQSLAAALKIPVSQLAQTALAQPLQTNQPSTVSPSTQEPPEGLPFLPWHLPPTHLQAGSVAEIQSVIYRRGKLWAQVRCSPPNARWNEFQALFTAADPRSGQTDVIEFPSRLGIPDPHPSLEISSQPAFEVTADSLFVSAQDRIHRYRFRERKWETLRVPLQRGATITEIASRLYLASDDSLLVLAPESNTIQIVASSRRRPATNPLDELGSFHWVYSDADNTIGILAHNRLFRYSPEKRSCSEVSLPVLAETQGRFGIIPTLCESGILFLELPMDLGRMSVVWQDDKKMEVLLQEGSIWSTLS
ncbi:MAG TPA: hypothetical protein VNZ22_06945, partial [Bacillota bacterium]|nr:hypothetical protein [Bacillota bacterium]